MFNANNINKKLNNKIANGYTKETKLYCGGR